MVGAAKKSERGVALLVTMMALALMTMLVMDFTTAASLGYRAAAGQANELRSEYLARSAISVGLSLLSTDAQQDALAKTPHDGLDEPWAQPYPPVPLGGGEAQVSIVDEARKIDINLLINPRTGQPNPIYVAIVERLFTNIGVSPDIVPAIVDWLDPDSIESPGGAEADYYMRLIPPYEPRNGPMPTIGDLRMIRGVDDATFSRLQQFLTAAPEPRVNINTAPPEVIAALVPQLSDNISMVKQIVQARMVQPFLMITDVGNLAGLGDAATPLMRLITTRSAYFTLTGIGVFAGARRRVTGTFRRNANGTSMLASWQED
ncbi:MAG TPA: type II secretion system minor pseudopilin GspK [Candidatus Binataceae bacterium]|nr:type II secretion system minor pseudopilin GspK [Candidatus Binataceae bacterium]